MTNNEKERVHELEENRADLAKLANAFGEEAGRPLTESMGDVVTRDYEDTDFAALLSDREISDTLLHMLDENREQVERALQRLAEGLYGVCEDCETRIPPERLRFKPEATRCVDCQGRWDRTNRRSA
jgi:DnaK suppressor protein